MEGLKFHTDRPNQRTVILRLTGEFEGLPVLNAKEELLGLVRNETAQDFMVDFGEIEYVDSAAIGVLLEMSELASGKNMKFGLFNVNDHVTKVIEITKVDKVLKIYR